MHLSVEVATCLSEEDFADSPVQREKKLLKRMKKGVYEIGKDNDLQNRKM